MKTERYVELKMNGFIFEVHVIDERYVYFEDKLIEELAWPAENKIKANDLKNSLMFYLLHEAGFDPGDFAI